MEKKALLLGVNYYEDFSDLSCCVEDAQRMKEILEKNDDGSSNFDCRIVEGTKEKPLTHRELSRQIDKLFQFTSDLTILYFSGHGDLRNGENYICPSDASNDLSGIKVNDIIKDISVALGKRKSKEVILILDSCYAGAAGGDVENMNHPAVNLPQGLTILTSSKGDEVSQIRNGSSLFTESIILGLQGVAGDLMGRITSVSLYNFVENILGGGWSQRPMLKSNIEKLYTLRCCAPKIVRKELQNLIKWFGKPDSEFLLSPEYEKTVEPKDLEKEEILRQLQEFRSGGLIDIPDEKHLYYAAMNNKVCCLSPLGKMYWHLVKNGKI